MDICREYIEMCGKAEEIQVIRVSKVKDFLTFLEGDFYAVIIGREIRETRISHYSNNDAHVGDFIWLPRQDQLQEMLPIIFTNIVENICRIGEFYTQPSDGIDALHYHSNSMEQFYLRIVMKEKYNKVWKDGAWQII
jgi:hypothetical protein